MTIILNFFYFLPLNISLINIHHILINKSNKYQKKSNKYQLYNKKEMFYKYIRLYYCFTNVYQIQSSIRRKIIVEILRILISLHVFCNNSYRLFPS